MQPLISNVYKMNKIKSLRQIVPKYKNFLVIFLTFEKILTLTNPP